MKKRGEAQGRIKTNMERRGPPITTNIDDKNAVFQHEYKHKKVVKATVIDYPGIAPTSSTPREHISYDHSLVLHASIPNDANFTSVKASRELVPSTPLSGQHHELHKSYQQITRNKRISTEVLGSSVESTKTSQRAPSGHRRITTHIVRKVTTLSRAEEQQLPPEDLLPPTKMLRSTDLQYYHTLPKTTAVKAIEPAYSSTIKTHRSKVFIFTGENFSTKFCINFVLICFLKNSLFTRSLYIYILSLYFT